MRGHVERPEFPRWLGDSEPESESDVLQDQMVKVKNVTKEAESRAASSKKGGGGGGDGGRGKGKGRAGTSHPKKK